MKKLAILTISALVVLTMIGCQDANDISVPDQAGNNISESDPLGNETEATPGELQYNNPIDSYDSEEQIAVSENSQDIFMLKAKKYKYYDNDVLILNVENKTASDYTITITVTYYDENSNSIGSESRVFEGFAAGWHNYFIFQPNMTFDSFDYKIDILAYDDKTYSGLIQTEVNGGRLNVDMNRSNSWINFEGELINHHDLYTGVIGAYQIINNHSETLYYTAQFIVFNNQGEIYHIGNKKSSGMDPLSESDHPYAQQIIYLSNTLWSNREEFVWPEELNGEIKGIVCFYKIDIKPTNR